jgi:hypothetical protein
MDLVYFVAGGFVIAVVLRLLHIGVYLLGPHYRTRAKIGGCIALDPRLRL